MKKKDESILENIGKKINKKCNADLKKYEKEKDEIKQLKLLQKITWISISIILKEIKKLSNAQFEKFTDEFFEPLAKQSYTITEQMDKLVYGRSQDITEYKKYEKKKRILDNVTNDFFTIVDKEIRNKKDLERFLLILFYYIFNNELTQIQNYINFNEFTEAGNIVYRRFGFGYDWLVCLALIQLHENLIKKKISDLKGEFKDDEPIKLLIPKLSKLIKDKEKRNVSVSLLSTSIKSIRDTMSHEGFKHHVSKSDLRRILKEVLELEAQFYPKSKK